MNIQKDDKFGRLTVIDKVVGGKYRCVCVCGNVRDVIKAHLVKGETVSCGCKKREDITKRRAEEMRLIKEAKERGL